MHETHSMLFLYFTSFTISLTSALTLVNPLQLLPASPANNNTPITITNNNNTAPRPPLPPNPSLLPPPTATGLVSYVCNGDAFGYGLDVDSCTDAIRFLGVNTTQLSFGMRNTGGNFDIPLPQRFISSNGKCVIEPALDPGVAVARASPEDMAVASFVLVRNCVGRDGGRGGIARDIGGDNNLRVFVSKYDPDHVRCYGKMRQPKIQVSCLQLLNSMSTNDQNIFFGPKSDPLVNVQLPFLLLSKDRKCKMTIRTTGQGAGYTDMWSWGKFWENGVALAGMCVREGKEGVQTRLGEHGYLYMEVGGPQSGGGSGTVA